MKRSPRIALVLGTATLVAAAITPSIPAIAATPVTATFQVTSAWESGHTVSVTVKNGTSSRVAAWEVRFDVPEANTITKATGADVSRSGLTYTAKQPKTTGSLAPGSSRTWSYTSGGTFVAPGDCRVNGRASACGVATTNRVATTSASAPDLGGAQLIGYFPSWGIYGRNYHVKKLETSGNASRLTQIIYGFGKVINGKCATGDAWADSGKAYTADTSVDGVADTWTAGSLRGNFGQLSRLKAMHPNLKVTWSFGGWTYSDGFPAAAADPAAFAESCYQLVNDPRWSGLFDGVDIDWEFPNSCGVICDTSGPSAFKNVMSALRNRFGSNAVITAAITQDGRPGKTMDKSDYAGAASYVNWLMPMTYGAWGSWAPKGPTGLHSPINDYSGAPLRGLDASATITALIRKGVPASKILLGVDFYGRGWTGVTKSAPGGSVTGLAKGTFTAGVENYDTLRTKCPTTGTLAGTAYAKCGSDWWSYDNPSTVKYKMRYARSRGIGGAFIWELTGDTARGDLVSAMTVGLQR